MDFVVFCNLQLVSFSFFFGLWVSFLTLSISACRSWFPVSISFSQCVYSCLAKTPPATFPFTYSAPPHWPFWWSSNLSSSFLPQGLGTCFSLCLKAFTSKLLMDHPSLYLVLCSNIVSLWPCLWKWVSDPNVIMGPLPPWNNTVSNFIPLSLLWHLGPLNNPVFLCDYCLGLGSCHPQCPEQCLACRRWSMGICWRNALIQWYRLASPSALPS